MNLFSEKATRLTDPNPEDLIIVQPQTLTMVLAVVAPPSCTQTLLNELAAAKWTAQKWHIGGRQGVLVTAVDNGASRAIPITRAAAAAVGFGAGAASADSALTCTPELAKLLYEGRAEIRNVAAASQKCGGQKQHTDHTVHPERRHHRPAAAVASAAKVDGAFTFVELFAGIGGFRVGLQPLGGRCVFASELDPEAAAVYSRQFSKDDNGAHITCGDICTVPDDAIPPHDMLTAGFPCQAFSSLGSQPGLGDAKGTLFLQIVRVLRLRQPRTFLLENVPGAPHSTVFFLAHLHPSAMRGSCVCRN